jgi:ATP-dependent DNA helicase RecQ
VTDPTGRLRSALLERRPPDISVSNLPLQPTFAYAVERFLSAWSQSRVFGPDEVVLLRQAIRWSNLESILVGQKPDEECWLNLQRAGIEWGFDGHLRANPYLPDWICEKSPIDNTPVERSLKESFEAESFLHSMGYKSWRSPAQKEAAWFTLSAPNGSTRLIVLPTGSGKSLCFQLLPRFSSGLTVVVVPTIALAIDQQIGAARIFANFPDINPCYYAADEDAKTTLSLVSQGNTRLLYTSPEAIVSGSLRPILDEFARKGEFTNLVVDEAHLIETWGAQFRVEFQILSGVRKKWLESSPPDKKITTYLFSATMTEACRSLMHELFSENVVPQELVSQRLRPEIEYFSKMFKAKNERDDALIEMLWRLPRPAIVYVTEKKDAEKLLERLKREGFKRVACFHGDTRKNERRTILNRWKNNEIDLVVATSAFGVGVDKPDVRIVIHACYPENLDRFYQEVGRGGRDGWSSSSFLMPTPEDRQTADKITVNLLKPEMIQARWVGMYAGSRNIDNLCYDLPVSARPTHLIGQRTYGEHVKWNKRLLVQLKRAKLIELEDIILEKSLTPDDESEEWVSVRVIGFQPNTNRLGEIIEKERNEEIERFRFGLAEVGNFLKQDACSARIIGNLYGIDGDNRKCPGCPYCRSKGRPPSQCNALPFQDAMTFSEHDRSIWIEGFPDFSSQSNKILFIDAIHKCVTLKKIRHFFCTGDHYSAILDCFAQAFESNAVLKHSLYRLDSDSVFKKLGSATLWPVVFLHFGAVNVHAIQMGRKFPCVHLYSGSTFGNGRDITVDEKFNQWNSLDAWLSESNEISLPCLPTTL